MHKGTLLTETAMFHPFWRGMPLFKTTCSRNGIEELYSWS